MKRIIPYLLVLVMLAACGGLPKEAKETAKSLEEKYTKTLNYIATQETSFAAMLKGPDAAFIKPYAKSEGWPKKFEEAKVMVADAKKYETKVIDPLLKRNNGEEANSLYTCIRTVKTTLNQAKALARAPGQRGVFLINAKKDAPKIHKKSKSEVEALEIMVAKANAKSEKAKKDAKKKKWPKTAKEIDKVFSPLQNDLNAANKASAILNNEMAKVSKGNTANYAIIGDKAVEISNLLAVMKKKQPAFLSKTDQLYRSYSKTLSDMRIEYYVVIGRASWNSNSDWDSTPDRNIASKEVSEAVYNYFEKLETVATYGYGWGREMDVKVDKTYWNALKINPLVNFPSGDNQAEFWSNDVTTKTYHKYTITENEKERETDWQAVSEDFYWANDENLSMTIVSKPYGLYESDTIKEAAPKGMQYVAATAMVAGVPTGENQYGKWKQDSSGNSFFHYYGMYALLFGGNSYSYNDYNGYNNRNRGSGYYGHGNSYGTYGHNTYRKGSRYGKSNYAKRNAGSVNEARASKQVRTKGKSQKSSVRSAGKTTRGRGASGKGGK